MSQPATSDRPRPKIQRGLRSFIEEFSYLSMGDGVSQSCDTRTRIFQSVKGKFVFENRPQRKSCNMNAAGFPVL
jgi:hypothetical protein